MSWYEEYYQALQKRNEIELRSKEVYDHYTRLARRIASIETQDRKTSTSGSKEARSTGAPSRSDSTKAQPKSEVPSSDLADAQKARSQLEAKLRSARQELEIANTTSSAEKKRIRDLTAESTTYMTKLRDRDEELREKAKLLDNVHDEMLALTMQLNVIEERNQKLVKDNRDIKKENKELVDRWMARMGQEADAMNDASKFS